MRSIVLRLLVLLLVFGGCCGTLHAARLSERSPVRLGLWWDPQHSGSGFELFQGGDQVAVIWYTYRPDGSPVWYSAIAPFAADGSWESPLYRHRWVDGAQGEAVQVGTLRFSRRHFESLTLNWELDGSMGQQDLQPFPVSGMVPEIDHSGAWFDPQRSGFGLSLAEQGEWLGAALYFYDAQGEPTWRVGNNEGHGTELRMEGVTGTCPGCTTRESKVLDAGHLALNFGSETALSARYSGTGTATWALEGGLVQLSTPASRRPADRQLATFDDDASLRRYLDEAIFDGMPIDLVVDFSAPPEAASFSPTNVQEAGVDEADHLKSDGRWIYAFARDSATGRDLPQVRVAEVRDEGRQIALHAPIGLPASDMVVGYSGMYVTDDRLLAMQATAPRAYGIEPFWISPHAWLDGTTRVSVFDRAAPSAPAALWEAEFDAHLVTSRRIGDRVYLVLRKTISVPGLEYGYDADAARDARNRARIAAMPLVGLLPRVRIGSGEWRALLSAEDIHLPVTGAIQPSPEFVAVVAIDLRSPDVPDAMGVIGSVNTVYASPGRMYLATTRSGYAIDPFGGYRPEGFPVTDIHEIALGEQGPAFAATGTVEGYLDRDPDRAPFRFSERDGRLRVVTVGGPWRELGQNRLTVLERSGVAPGMLRTLSYLPSRSRPAPLGKPDEHLYGTRFVDDRLYAVTFLKIDPLYVVDLSDPADPFIAGELELPGFSDYLHPVGEDVLLGVGLDARPAQSSWGDGQFAWYQGLLFSLFDVSDPARPRLLQQMTLGKRGSSTALLSNHHALSVLPGASGTTVALPVRVHAPDGTEPLLPSDNFTYPWSWSGLQTLEVVGTRAADAQLVSHPPLVTHQRSATERGNFRDDAAIGARSVQFLRGTVYLENGRFWVRDRRGALLSGPQ